MHDRTSASPGRGAYSATREQAAGSRSDPSPGRYQVGYSQYDVSPAPYSRTDPSPGRYQRYDTSPAPYTRPGQSPSRTQVQEGQYSTQHLSSQLHGLSSNISTMIGQPDGAHSSAQRQNPSPAPYERYTPSANPYESGGSHYGRGSGHRMREDSSATGGYGGAVSGYSGAASGYGGAASGYGGAVSGYGGAASGYGGAAAAGGFGSRDPSPSGRNMGGQQQMGGQQHWSSSTGTAASTYLNEYDQVPHSLSKDSILQAHADSSTACDECWIMPLFLNLTMGLLLGAAHGA